MRGVFKDVEGDVVHSIGIGGEGLVEDVEMCKAGYLCAEYVLLC